MFRSRNWEELVSAARERDWPLADQEVFRTGVADIVNERGAMTARHGCSLQSSRISTSGSEKAYLDLLS
ncbi:MAG: hypothetical protein IPL83_16260 [Bdellovibrionales bacterium]|nr:hypothetical protein [Bdellovibrionales bacterium]